MLPHRWLTRLLRALLALWFVVAGGELGVVHGCPMHDGAVGHAHAIMGTDAPAAAHGMHARAHAHGTASHDGGAPEAAHDCTCIGDCSAAAATIMRTAMPLVAGARVLHVATVSLPEVRRITAASDAYLLPFGNGPPRRIRSA